MIVGDINTPFSIMDRITRQNINKVMEDLNHTINQLDLKDIYKTLYPRTAEGTSLVVQWLRIRLPMQGTQVRALVREDPTCRGATKPVCHNY